MSSELPLTIRSHRSSIPRVMAGEIFSTLSNNVFKIGLSAATYDAGVLTVPVMALGDSYYQLELNISNEQPIEFQLASATAISNPNTMSMSRFAGDTLTIPQLVAGSLRYRIELRLTNSDPVTLQLSSVEELQ